MSTDCCILKNFGLNFLLQLKAIRVFGIPYLSITCDGSLSVKNAKSHLLLNTVAAIAEWLIGHYPAQFQRFFRREKPDMRRER